MLCSNLALVAPSRSTPSDLSTDIIELSFSLSARSSVQRCIRIQKQIQKKRTHSCCGRLPDCCFCDQPREERKIRKGEEREGRKEGGLKLNEDALNRELPWKLATMPTWGIKNKLLSPGGTSPEVCFEFERETLDELRKQRCSGRQPFYKWIRVLFQQQDFHDPS